MRLKEDQAKKRVLNVLGDPIGVEILGQMVKPMSVKQVSEIFGIPLSTAYRYIDALKNAGLLVLRSSVITETGAKYNLYESTVKSISISFEAESVQVDLAPSEKTVGAFVRAWRKIGEQ